MNGSHAVQPTFVRVLHISARGHYQGYELWSLIGNTSKLREYFAEKVVQR